MSHQSQTDKRFQNISEAKNADGLELLLLLLLMVSDISLSEFHFKVCEQFVRRLKRPEVSGTVSSLVLDSRSLLSDCCVPHLGRLWGSRAAGCWCRSWSGCRETSDAVVVSHWAVCTSGWAPGDQTHRHRERKACREKSLLGSKSNNLVSPLQLPVTITECITVCSAVRYIRRTDVHEHRVSTRVFTTVNMIHSVFQNDSHQSIV